MHTCVGDLFTCANRSRPAVVCSRRDAGGDTWTTGLRLRTRPGGRGGDGVGACPWICPRR